MDVIALVGLLIVLALLVLAIVRWGVHPFLALTVASLAVGPVMGLSASAAVEEFLTGFGATLKWIGVVLVLGAIIGELLEASGGVLRIADTVLRAVGRRRLPLAMGLTGYAVSIPAFVDVAYIMLKPVVEVLAARSGRRVLVVGLSLTAGLTATHALLPPTPGPLATAAILGASLGRVILINAIVAAFALGAGLLWATLYCRRFELDSDRTLHVRYAEASPPERGATSRGRPRSPPSPRFSCPWSSSPRARSWARSGPPRGRWRSATRARRWWRSFSGWSWQRCRSPGADGSDACRS